MMKSHSQIKNNELKFIKRLCDQYFGFDIAQKSRRRPIVLSRFMFFKIAREFFPDISLAEIGGMANRDHSLVVHGLNQIDNWIETEVDTRENFINLRTTVIEKTTFLKSGPFTKYLGDEDIIQHNVMNYISLQYPNAYAIHVPNEGKRTPFERFKFKYLGGKSGIPDVLIFQKSGEFNGLAIELKAGKNRPTKNQLNALDELSKSGWKSVWCQGFDNAKTIIDEYFNNESI